MAQEKICPGAVKWELGGNERELQAGGMCLRTFWVENSESEFHKEKKERTTQNNLRMGIAEAETGRSIILNIYMVYNIVGGFFFFLPFL